MFTGIIECTGKLAAREIRGEDHALVITSPAFDFSQCALGDSIAVDGVCLTVVALLAEGFRADVSAETLSLTTLGTLPINNAVNLERALTPSTALGGHLVSGHVDGIVKLVNRYPDGRSERMDFSIPEALRCYIAKKGSVTLNGVSLTVNEVSAETFSINMVPHTLEKTTFSGCYSGCLVNLEVDIIARYLHRLMTVQREAASLTLSNEPLVTLEF